MLQKDTAGKRNKRQVKQSENDVLDDMSVADEEDTEDSNQVRLGHVCSFL